MLGRFVLLAAIAALPAVALAEPAVVAAPSPPPVNIRVSPDLADALPAIKSAVAVLPNARIAEPADYILTTKRDYPQTLIATDAFQPDTADPNYYHDPLTVELGNLVLGDYGQPLRRLVANSAMAKGLIARARLSQGRDAVIETCIKPVDGSPQCEGGPLVDGAIPLAARDLDYTNSTVAVHNHSAAAHYVALFLVDPAFGVHRLSLNGADGDGRIAAGSSADTDPMAVQGDPSGPYRIIIYSSDQPFASGSPDVILDRPGVHASVLEHRQVEQMLAEMGGGDEVLDAMAPWMAELYSTVPYTREEKAADALKPADQQEHLSERSDAELDHRCGGTLIAPEWVVTAAHCVATGKYDGDGMVRVLKERRVRLGTKFLGNGGTTYAVVAVAVPADYSPVTKRDDIALLRLKSDRDTSWLEVQPLAIGSRPLAASTALTTYGWGYTGSVPAGNNPLFNAARELQHNPDFLRFGRVAVLDWNRCKQRLALVAGGMVCVVAPDATGGGTSQHNVFTCRGDSGGPLVRSVGGKDELVGVTSWSMGCGYRDYPSVFTDVTKYGPWIEAARRQLTPGEAIRIPNPAAVAADQAGHR